eukprot:5412406-Amphidinium_carterae.1
MRRWLNTYISTKGIALCLGRLLRFLMECGTNTSYSNNGTCKHLAIVLTAMAQNILPPELQRQLMAARMIPLPKSPKGSSELYALLAACAA